MMMAGIKKFSFDFLWCRISFLFCCIVITTSTRIYCPPPDVPSNGKYEPKSEKYTPGSEVIYACYRDFAVSKGSSIRECQIDGTWSERTPFCDGPETFKIVRGLLKPSNNPTDSMFDGNIKSCHTLCNGCEVQLDLEKAVVVHGFRIYRNRGSEEVEIGYGVRNNVNFGVTFTRYGLINEMYFSVSFSVGGSPGWSEAKWDRHSVIADKIVMRKKRSQSEDNTVTVCEIQVLGFGKDESGCTHPPEMTVPNGYFEVNRNTATLICHDGYTSKNEGLHCEQNSWIDLSPSCYKTTKEASTNIDFETTKEASTNIDFGLTNFL